MRSIAHSLFKADYNLTVEADKASGNLCVLIKKEGRTYNCSPLAVDFKGSTINFRDMSSYHLAEVASVVKVLYADKIRELLASHPSSTLSLASYQFSSTVNAVKAWDTKFKDGFKDETPVSGAIQADRAMSKLLRVIKIHQKRSGQMNIGSVLQPKVTGAVSNNRTDVISTSVEESNGLMSRALYRAFYPTSIASQIFRKALDGRISPSSLKTFLNGMAFGRGALMTAASPNSALMVIRAVNEVVLRNVALMPAVSLITRNPAKVAASAKPVSTVSGVVNRMVLGKGASMSAVSQITRDGVRAVASSKATSTICPIGNRVAFGRSIPMPVAAQVKNPVKLAPKIDFRETKSSLKRTFSRTVTEVAFGRSISTPLNPENISKATLQSSSITKSRRFQSLLNCKGAPNFCLRSLPTSLSMIEEVDESDLASHSYGH